MKNNFLIIFTFLIFYKENTAQSFKDLYFESLYFLEVYDFDNALPILEKLYDIDPRFMALVLMYLKTLKRN